jgi:hypothetical protein
VSKGDLPGNALRLPPGLGGVRTTALADGWLELSDLVIQLAGPVRRAA